MNNDCKIEAELKDFNKDVLRKYLGNNKIKIRDKGINKFSVFTKYNEEIKLVILTIDGSFSIRIEENKSKLSGKKIGENLKIDIFKSLKNKTIDYVIEINTKIFSDIINLTKGE